MGDFRNEEYDLTPDQARDERAYTQRVFLWCVGIVAIVLLVWVVLQVGEPALDRLDAENRATERRGR